MKSIPETGHEKMGENSKKSYKNDLCIQGFEL